MSEPQPGYTVTCDTNEIERLRAELDQWRHGPGGSDLLLSEIVESLERRGWLHGNGGRSG